MSLYNKRKRTYIQRRGLVDHERELSDTEIVVLHSHRAEIATQVLHEFFEDNKTSVDRDGILRGMYYRIILRVNS